MAEALYYITSDNVLELTVTDEIVSPAITVDTATCRLMTLTFVDGGGDVSGMSLPATFSFVADGVYRLTLVDTLSVSKFDELEAVVEADDGAGRKGTMTIPIVVIRKKQD